MCAKLCSSYITTEKIIKIKNSITDLYESVFIYSILISYHTDCHRDDCSYCYVRRMFASFNMIYKPAFSLILFLKILKLCGLQYA